MDLETKGVGLSHLLWLPAAAVLGFGVSFLLDDVLTLPVVLYHLVYFIIVGAFLATYVRSTDLDQRAWSRRRLVPALALGVLGGLVLMCGVLGQPPSSGPSGWLLVWAILYRGVLYGLVDGLLLLAFPWVVVWRVVAAEVRGPGSRMAAGALAMVAILTMTTSYHLGYEDFRSSRILLPNVGAVISGLPTLLSANPVASPVSHVILHVTAVVHTPQSDLYLPPHRSPRP